MEKEYVVTLKSADDATQFHTEMTQSAGEGGIPNRTVDVANLQPGSLRNTTYALSDEEAAALTNDPRVEAVEIPFHLRPNAEVVPCISEPGDYRKIFPYTRSANWALYRCSYAENPYNAVNDGNTYPDVGDGSYHYHLDGTGVDVVIVDNGILTDHPEWEDADGNSRFQQIDWYTAAGVSGTQSQYYYTSADHGTSVASIAAGKTFGFAKNAHIYFAQINGAPFGPGLSGSPYSVFDLIRLWHNNKPLQVNGYKRPTVVNCSFMSAQTANGSAGAAPHLPDSITYRGTTYTGTQIDTLAKCQQFGFLEDRNPTINSGNEYRYSMAARVAAQDAEVADLIAAGVHVVGAVGNRDNSGNLAVSSTDADYNNEAYFSQGLRGDQPGSAVTVQYHRGASPASAPDVICVGGTNISEDKKEFGWASMSDYRGNLTDIYDNSVCGSRVDVFAPGRNLSAAGYDDNTAYHADSNYWQRGFSGTSGAAPLVTGVAALAAQLNPHMTPAQMREYITTKCVSENQIANWGETGPVYSSTEYANTAALNGSPNKFLFNPFGTVETYKVGS